MKIILCSFILLFISCNDDKKANTNNVQERSSIPGLLGKWGGTEGGPSLEIKEDSIYYYSYNKSHPYKLVGDTLFLPISESDSFTVWGTAKVIADTFFLIEGNTITKSYRIK